MYPQNPMLLLLLLSPRLKEALKKQKMDQHHQRHPVSLHFHGPNLRIELQPVLLAC